MEKSVEKSVQKSGVNYRKHWLLYVSAGCVCILFYVVITHMDRIAGGFKTLGYFVYPVFMGLVIAYVLSPLVKMLQQKMFWWIRSPALNRNVSVIVVLILLLLIVTLVVVGLVPQMIDSVVKIFGNMDTYRATIRDALDRLREFAAQHNFDISETTQTLNDMAQNLTNVIGANANRILDTSFSVGKGIFNFVIACILAFYFLFDKFPFQQNNHRFWKAVLSQRMFEQTIQFLSQCNDIIVRFIKSELLDALIVGVANAVFMTIMQMPYAVLISVVICLTNLAPTFGPIVGGAIGALILVLVNPWDALAFLIFTVILQTVDGYVIKPKLFGNMLGISSVWILASIIIGGRVLGVLGILVAIPIAAIIGLGYRDYLLPALEEWRARRGGESFWKKAMEDDCGSEDENVSDDRDVSEDEDMSDDEDLSEDDGVSEDQELS